MKLRPLPLLGLLVLLGQICLVSAQDPAELENTRFIGALRQRGDFDLARLYLERMKREAKTPAALELLQLEVAKLRLIEASVEPDSSRRQTMLTEAQQEFEQFLAKNKTHPRAAEVRLEIAQVAVQQGRILLSKALSQETVEPQRREGARARAVLAELGKRLVAGAKEMDFALEGLADPKTDKEKAERRRLEEERMQAHLGVGQNLFDQAMTYSREDQSGFKARADKVLQAQKALDMIAAENDAFPQAWTAKAWMARCLHENGDPKNARVKLKELAENRLPASLDARRQAKYFLMLALQESVEIKDRLTQIEDLGKEWLKTYDRSYKNTPEGYGVRYLLAEIHLGRAAAAKGKQKEDELSKARALLTEVEHGDNEFSERARRKKLGVIASQGGFEKKIEELKTFEDCFIRSQYEISLIDEEVKKILHVDEKTKLKDPAEEEKAQKKRVAEAEKAREKRIDTVLAALDRGLQMPDARAKRSPEIGTARVYQAYYCLNTKRYPACIRHGEVFAREDAQAAQAANAAMYALQAYSEMVRDKEVTLEKSTGVLTDDNGQKVDAATYARGLAETKKKMIDFARYVEKIWPKEQAGDLARHQLAILLFHEKADGEQKVKNFHDAVRALSSLQPNYPAYSRAMFLLALKTMEADRDKLPPLPEPAGQPLSWKQRTLNAFAAIPEPSGDEADANEQYIRARTILGNEMYKEKKFDELDKMAEQLVARVSSWKFNNEELRNQFKSQIQFLRYFARYGLADAAMQANDPGKVLTLLDGFVDEVKAAGDHPIKTNHALGQNMLSMAPRSAIQTGKLDRALAAAQALQKIIPVDTDPGASVLGMLVALINKQLDEAKQKNDKARREQLVKGYGSLLDDLTKGASLTPLYLLRLAQCYSSMDQHAKAIDTLSKFPKPKEGDGEGEKLHKSCQLNLIRELRLNKEAKKVRPILDGIIGTKEKPGWGARNPDALMESIYLLNEDEKYAETFAKSSAFTKALSSKLEDNTMKGFYLESYYQMVYAMVKFAGVSKDPAKKERHILEAAKEMKKLEIRFPGFGNDATAQQFKDLMEKEAELKKVYDKIKADTPAGKQ